MALECKKESLDLTFLTFFRTRIVDRYNLVDSFLNYFTFIVHYEYGLRAQKYPFYIDFMQIIAKNRNKIAVI